MQPVDATPKEKGSKPIFWRRNYEEYPQATRAVHMFNQVILLLSLKKIKE